MNFKIAFGAILAVLVIGMALYFWRRGGWTRFHQKVVGWTVIGYAVYLATLTGTAWKFFIPGFGSVGAGAVTGAFIGVLAHLVLGTLGIATGGIALAAGMGTLAVVFGGVGVATGWIAGFFSGGYGFHRVSYPLVHWAFWVPILLLGAYFLWNSRRRPPPSPQVLPDEN